MTKIYLVEDGEYSDYKIVAAFSTEEKAEKFQEAFNFKSVMEMELDQMDPCGELALQGYKCWHVTMDLYTGSDIHGGAWRAYGLPAWGDGCAYKDHDNFDMFEIEVMATGEFHARKIANEKRIQYLAMKEIKEKAKEMKSG